MSGPERRRDWLHDVLADGAMRYAYRAGVRALLGEPGAGGIEPLPAPAPGAFPYVAVPRGPEALPPLGDAAEPWRRPVPARPASPAAGP
ncbi:MAG TPA: hypothetical protein VHF89_11935, partial [Solirubrobacteraceae bacterium]|nr:hypothetical protein [Solirubrobacteraceae bacterium]